MSSLWSGSEGAFHPARPHFFVAKSHGFVFKSVMLSLCTKPQTKRLASVASAHGFASIRSGGDSINVSG